MLSDPETRLFRPDEHCGTGVLVVAGSSGRIDAGRAELLSRWGALALAIRWFGGAGQQPGPYEVPVELFSTALDQLQPECDRLAILGTSFGAEGMLLAATHDRRIAATVAFAPSSVVWPGWDGRQWRSHWTHDGTPLPYVTLAPAWEPDDDPPSYVGLYAESLNADPQLVERASIPVERIPGDVVLVAGGDDRVWPSVRFASAIAARRRAHGRETTVITHGPAGHRTVLPDEPAVQAGATMRRGGSPASDRALGARAWPAIAAALSLRHSPARGARGIPPMTQD